MIPPPPPPGFFGKVPLKGDFVTQRLPASFVSVWDHWLKAVLSESRQALGEDWLDLYLTNPIWRFMLGSRVIGEDAWIGVLMPSVDSVGRYFPLTLTARIEAAQAVAKVCSQNSVWFDQLEQLALTALEDDFDLTVFDQQLQRLVLPDPDDAPPVATRFCGPEGISGGLRLQPTVDESGDTAFALCAQLILAFLPSGSLWTTGTAKNPPFIWMFEGLPSAQDYARLLNETGGPAPSTEQPPPSMEEECWEAELPVQEPRQEVPPPINLEPPQKKSASPRWRSWAKTDTGKRRSHNQDAFLDRGDLGLWVVADGMGGHSAGEVASRMAVDQLGQLAPMNSRDALADAAIEVLQKVNRDLVAMAQEIGQEHIIGSTVVSLAVSGHHCAVIWAGDSRLYRLREGKLAQLTEDHSVAAEMAASEPSETISGGLGDNIVTRALGADADLELDRIDFEAVAGDRFLLCSDGLTKELHPAEIEHILRTADGEESVKQLMALALERQARDNVTAIVVDGASSVVDGASSVVDGT